MEWRPLRRRFVKVAYRPEVDVQRMNNSVHHALDFSALVQKIAQMLTQREIESLVLHICSSDAAPCAIQSCELSADKTYWIVRANSAQYVLHGRSEFCLVGVNAYLVDPSTGEIEVVGSGCSVEQYLGDKQDVQLAGQKKYVLHPAFDGYEPKWVIHLHQKIGCSLPDARRLARNTEWWVTGKKRVLEEARDLLAKEGIPVNVTLAVNAGMAQILADRPVFWDELKRVLQATVS